MTTIVGLAGYAGAGKSTIARELVFALQREKATSAVASFAAAIKVMSGGLLDYLESSERSKESEIVEGVTRRKLEQVIGTECGRSIRPDFWVQVLVSRLSTSVYENLDFVIVDDVRFPEEVEMIIKKKGLVVGIDTDDLLYPEHVYNHPSEQYDVLKSAYGFPTVHNDRLALRPTAQEIIGVIMEKNLL